MRRLAPLLCLLALGSLGCGGEGANVEFTFELANASGSCEGPTVDPDVGRPGAITAIEVSICKCESSDRAACFGSSASCDEFVEIMPDPEQPDGGLPSPTLGNAIVVPVGSGGTDIKFRARLPGGPYRVVTRFLDGGSLPFAEGVTVVDSFAGARIRAYRYQQTSCAGRGDDAPRSRALHHAFRLPNDQVLIFGGVVGDASQSASAQTVGEIEIYDPVDDTFRTVGPDRLNRSFFAAQLLPGPVEGPYQVKIVGGFALGSGLSAPGARVDARGTNSFAHATIVPPSMGVDPAGDQILEYDPSSGQATIRNDAALWPNAGGNVVGEFAGNCGDPPQADCLAPVLLGLESSFTDITTPHRYVSDYWWMRTDGRPRRDTGDIEAKFNLLAARLGATATPLATRSLVWGGGVDLPNDAEVLANAGELLDPGSVMPTAVAAGIGTPGPTAFHSATRIDGGALVAGGLLVGCRSGCVRNGVSRQPTMQPLTMFREMGGTVVATAPFPGPYTGSVHHAATLLPASGSRPEGVAIVGGATSGGPGNELVPSDQLILATPTMGQQLVPRGGPDFATLARGRFGLTATHLPHDRLLVLGGFISSGDAQFATVPDAEIINLDPGPGDTAPPDAGAPDAGLPTDAGPPMDGALSDGAVDAGP